MLKLMKQAKAAFSLLSADEIAKQASVPVHVGLVADGSGAYAEMEELLVPSTLPRPEWRQRMMQVHRANDTAVPSQRGYRALRARPSLPRGLVQLESQSSRVHLGGNPER